MNVSVSSCKILCTSKKEGRKQGEKEGRKEMREGGREGGRRGEKDRKTKEERNSLNRPYILFLHSTYMEVLTKKFSTTYLLQNND